MIFGNFAYLEHYWFGPIKTVLTRCRFSCSLFFKLLKVRTNFFLETDQDLLLGVLPFYHIYGLVVILLNGLKSGSAIVTLPKFEKASFVQLMEKHKVG